MRRGPSRPLEKRMSDCDDVIERAEFYAPLLKEVAEKMVAKVEAVKARLGKCIEADGDDDAVFAQLDAKLASKATPAPAPTVKKAEPKAEPKAEVELDDASLFNI